MCGVFNNELNLNWENAVFKKNIFELKCFIEHFDYFDDDIVIARPFHGNTILVISSSSGTVSKITLKFTLTF